MDRRVERANWGPYHRRQGWNVGGDLSNTYDTIILGTVCNTNPLNSRCEESTINLSLHFLPVDYCEISSVLLAISLEYPQRIEWSQSLNRLSDCLFHLVSKFSNFSLFQPSLFIPIRLLFLLWKYIIERFILINLQILSSSSSSSLYYCSMFVWLFSVWLWANFLIQIVSTYKQTNQLYTPASL